MKQNQAGKTFKTARMRLHRILGQTRPISRVELAEMALEMYGPIEGPLNCRNTKADPTPLDRWVSKIQALERKPGARSINDEHAYQLCELLRIRRLDDREEIDLDLAIAHEKAA